jgi:hypothetical protein
MAHRSHGPWRLFGKRATARKIIETYNGLDAPRPWRETWARYGGVRIMHPRGPAPECANRGQKPPEIAREQVAICRHLIAFKSLFDSMAAPSIDERITPSWEWVK